MRYNEVEIRAARSRGTNLMLDSAAAGIMKCRVVRFEETRSAGERRVRAREPLYSTLEFQQRGFRSWTQLTLGSRQCASESARWNRRRFSRVGCDCERWAGTEIRPRAGSRLPRELVSGPRLFARAAM
jgi:hypothetical protein